MRTTTLALLLLLALAPAAAAADGSEVTALVVIDIQEFYFPGGRLPLVAPEAAAANARRLLDAFRGLGWPVLHVQHLPAGQERPSPAAGEPQYRIHETVRPLPGEVVIGKHHANAFRDTGLLEALRGAGATHLVIAGMQTHMCVEAAARAAADLGFTVTVVGDACATRALAFGGTEVPAEKVHAAALAALQGTYAEVVGTDAWLAAHLPPPAPPQ